MRKSLTLAELLISIVLFTILVMAMGSYHVIGQRFLFSTDRTASLLNEGNLILDMIARDALEGIGDVTGANRAFRWLAVTGFASHPALSPAFIIQKDRDNDGIYDQAVDRRVAYFYEPGIGGVGGTITRCADVDHNSTAAELATYPGGVYDQIMTSRVLPLTDSTGAPTGIAGFSVVNALRAGPPRRIRLYLSWDPAGVDPADMNTSSNPVIEVQTTVTSPGFSFR